MTKPSGSVTHVSDTARWVAMYRAWESERPDALFRDPWARKLAGPEGEAIVANMPQGKSSAWPMIVRTQVMDELIMRTVRADGADTVLNLAAGLDARPYRLPLSEKVKWIDADLPGILSYKKEQLAGVTPRCFMEFAQTDLTDPSARRELFTRVGAASKKTLVVAEGLLIYLTPEQVAELARDLAAQPSFRWWIIDLASPMLLKRLARTWGKSLSAAPLLFAPPEGTAFFEALGWKEQEFRSSWEESLRLKRSVRFAKFFNFLGQFYPKKVREGFRRFAGIVLLKRT